MRSLFRFGLPIVVAALVGIYAYAATGDSQSGTWTSAGETSTVRAHAASALLYDGRVLVTGGRSADGLLRSAELLRLVRASVRPGRCTPLAVDMRRSLCSTAASS